MTGSFAEKVVICTVVVGVVVVVLLKICGLSFRSDTLFKVSKDKRDILSGFLDFPFGDKLGDIHCRSSFLLRGVSFVRHKICCKMLQTQILI